jgi:hypothetical protein
MRTQVTERSVQYLHDYKVESRFYPLTRIEVEIKYSNCDTMSNSFADKEMALKFLNTYFPISKPRRMVVQQCFFYLRYNSL